MEGMKTVQIIIPVYNAEKTVGKCLDSLLAQTFTDWEAFLINDVSADGSVAVIEKYLANDERFVLLNNTERLGASLTRNEGLERLNGKYTAFLDSDDWWEPEMLERMIGEAEQNGADVVQCRYRYDFASGKQIVPKGVFPHRVMLSGKDLKKVYRRMMTGIKMNHVCMKLIRTELLEGLAFNPALRTAEDLEFCVRLFGRVKRYIFIPDVLYHYYRNDSSLTGSGLPFRVKLDANRRVSKVMLQMLPAWGIDSVFYRLLTVMRPYIIIVSKAFRSAQELLAKGRG